MNSEHYRNFIVIIETGTLSAASKKLHIAQPALSNQVKSMETLFGTTLFKRNARSMEPTEAGLILYEKARHIVLLEDAAAKEINMYCNGSSGTLCLGITQAYPEPTIEQLLQKFHKENPHIKFEIFELTSTEIIELIKSGIVEIGIIRTYHELPIYLKSLHEITERLVAVGRKDTQWLTLNDEIDLFTLKDIPLAISRGFQTAITETCIRSNFTPNIFSVSTSRNNALTWAKNGDAVAIIATDDTTFYESESMFCRPLSGEIIIRRTFATKKEHTLSAVADKFIEFTIQSDNSI